MKRLRVESDLRRALQKQEFELIYDPIVSCVDLTLRGLDALVQWSDTESGRKASSNCSNISDDARLVLHIGEWVIEEACRQRMQWRKALSADNPLFIGVGLSAAQLRNPELERLLRRVARDWPTEARNLAFEIHASTIEEGREVVRMLIDRKRAIGYKLHLTGTRRDLPASALLKVIPFDAVKIGGWHIDRLVGDNGRSDEMRKIIRDAHGLGTTVIAEGVDTEAHFMQVKDLGCDLCQGSFVMRKLDSLEVEALLKESFA
jgi:EAL domain-containing protein (putative c-di-GMP-specific phosphodiesterase class I)